MRKAVLLNGLGILAAAWRGRYLIAIPILLMPMIAVLVGLLSPKKYETYTTILIQEAAKQNPFLKDLTVETNLSGRMAALQALLHSRHILGEVAFEIGMIDKNTPSKKIARRISELSRSLNANLIGEDLVKISYRAEDPSDMANILGLVSQQFIERIIAPERSSIVSSEIFLRNELARQEKDLETAEERLAEYKTKFASELPELHGSNVARLGNTQEALARQRTELEGARAAWIDLQSRLFKTNPVVGELEQRIVETMSELTMLRARYTDQHSQVRAALGKLKSLEEGRGKVLRAGENRNVADIDRLWNMAANRSNAADGDLQPLLISQLERLQESKSRVSSLEKQVESLGVEIDQLESKVSGFGAHEKRLTELERDLKVKRKIYEDLAERHQMARVTGALGRAEESERVKIIDPPFTPLAPANLPLSIYVALGLLGGIALALGLAACAEVLDLTVRNRQQLERLTGVPVISRIPYLTVEGLCPEDDGGRLVMSAEHGGLRLVEAGHG